MICKINARLWYKVSFSESETKISDLGLVSFQTWSVFSRSKTNLHFIKTIFKVIRHVFGFGIEFLENKDIGIFGHFLVIDFIKWYSYHTYFWPISTSWFRRFGTGCIVRNGEWRIFVNYSVFSALFPLKLRVLFEEGILGTPVQKDAVPPIFISKYCRWKPNSTTTDLCIELSLFTSH